MMILKPLAKVQLEVDLQGLGGRKTLECWVELDPRGLAELLCPDCRRTTYLEPRKIQEMKTYRCSFCRRDQPTAEAFLLSYARLKQVLWKLAAKAGDATVQKVLERLFERLEAGF